MNSKIVKTKLWSNSLGSEDTNHEEYKERLRTALRLFRERVSQLATQIHATFPELTIHDVTHLDALWETADLIAGEDYPINPMEAFVLGGAILLHDAAHCFEAYQGGRDAVRDTVTWKDAFASEHAKNPDQPKHEIERFCDFTAVRLLHAEAAKSLAQLEWKNPNDASSMFLIDDTELRKKYGVLIGQIAASHNWDIDDVKSKLREQVNVPGGWPIDWHVDPVKIACLLRCADAAHLDDLRAPDFLFALIRRSGISLDHWKAQNWLARVDLDQSDKTRTSLLFTSNHAFESQDANAWWIAYDAIAVLDAEIKASNKLLLSRPQSNNESPAFKIQRVTGANSTSELNKSIETDGWTPTSAKIHVSNLERLVRTLGGESLYGQGDHFALVMRELIQNARDAIVARMSLAPSFTGKILVKVYSKSSTETYVEIQDDGVGMSERTMTSALLDFGTSFWASDLARSEFPGLRSSSFKPVGNFGIGFYSVFMVTSEVTVSSRRCEEGSSEVTKLSFPNGLTLRPILTKGADRSFDIQSTTSVRITIKDSIENVKNQIINKDQSDHEFRVPLKNYLATIVAGLDVSVALQIESEKTVSIHEAINDTNTKEQISDWIERITFFDVPGLRYGANTQDYVSDNKMRIRDIKQDDRIVGRAAVLDSWHQSPLQFLTTETIGGLNNQIPRGAGFFMGYMDNYAASAKRDVLDKIASIESLQSWANEQIAILKENHATPHQIYWAASNIANLKLDPIDFITFPIILPKENPNGLFLLPFQSLLNILTQGPIALLICRDHPMAEVNLPFTSIDNLPTLRPLGPGSLISTQIVNGKCKQPFSLIGCLERLLLSERKKVIYEVQPTDKSSFIGPTDKLIIRLQS